LKAIAATGSRNMSGSVVLLEQKVAKSLDMNDSEHCLLDSDSDSEK
jgi:hypothetical protein